MELLTLASTAVGMAIPYLVKSGEAIAEKVGEDIWSFVKSLFKSDEQTIVQEQLTNGQNNDEIIQKLIDKLNENPALQQQLEEVVVSGQKQLANNQTINNHGSIEKQININQNSGNIQM